MTDNELYFPTIDLHHTLNSGQTFLWERIDDFYIGTFTKHAIKIKQDGERIFWQTYPEKGRLDLVEEYFDTEFNYYQMLEQISKDSHVARAVETFPNLRMLNQPFEETLISFILAQNKNIPAIKQSLRKLAASQSKRIDVDGTTAYLFPSADFLANTSVEVLRNASLGYRVPYMQNVANFILGTTDTQTITRDALLEIHGVGDKVADCVLSFSLGQTQITPIDIWGDRIIKNIYKNYRAKTYKQKSAYLSRKFGLYTNYAGQFLFEWIRSTAGR